MVHNLPNTYISLPNTHILSPRFYTTSPPIPSRDSFYLPYGVSGSLHAAETLKRCSRNLASRKSTLNHKKNRNAISLRALEWSIGRFDLSLKQLFVSLYLWKSDSLTAIQVSDVFVRLATDFNAIIATLITYDISVLEFHSFELRLRELLEPCLNGTLLSDDFQQCVSGIEAVLEDVLPRLALKHTEVKQILEYTGSDYALHR